MTTMNTNVPVADPTLSPVAREQAAQEHARQEAEERIAGAVTKGLSPALEKLAGSSQGGISTELTEILAEPAVQELLAAKREGREPRITVGGGQIAPDPQGKPEIEMPDDLDAVDNRALLELGTKLSVKAVSDALVPEIENLLGQVDTRLKGIESQLDAGLKERAQGEIQALEGKYPDFNQYRKEISELVGKGIGLETAYKVAKMEATGRGPDDTSLDSERPTSPPRGGAETPYEGPTHGRRAFGGRLSAALDNTLAGLNLPE